MDASKFLTWAKPVRNSTCKFSDYKRRWARVVWLDSHRVLVGGLHDDDVVRWERLDTRTGQRHRESAFGAVLAKDYDATEVHPFEPIYASPDGKWLLGEHDVTRRSSVPGVLGLGGQQQKWHMGDDLWGGQLSNWLPGERSFVGFGFHELPSRHELYQLELGQTRPTILPLRGLPHASRESFMFLLGTTPRKTALLVHDTAIYQVPIEAGGRAHRLGHFVKSLNFNNDNSVDIAGVDFFSSDNWLLSPKGDLLVTSVTYDSEDKHGNRHAAAIWVCGTDGHGLREIGRTPWHKATQGEVLDYGLLALAWHPDSRRVSFYYGDSEGFHLYITTV